MNLIPFERPDGSEVWINPEHVTDVYISTLEPTVGMVCISTLNGVVVVKGDLEEVTDDLVDGSE